VATLFFGLAYGAYVATTLIVLVPVQFYTVLPQFLYPYVRRTGTGTGTLAGREGPDQTTGLAIMDRRTGAMVLLRKSWWCGGGPSLLLKIFGFAVVLKNKQEYGMTHCLCTVLMFNGSRCNEQNDSIRFDCVTRAFVIRETRA
jgi:hypothetical protein